METKVLPETSQDPIVYVKEVSVADLPQEVRDQVPGFTELYAVHDAKGEQLALVAERHMAFHLARENDMTPVSLH